MKLTRGLVPLRVYARSLWPGVILRREPEGRVTDDTQAVIVGLDELGRWGEVSTRVRVELEFVSEHLVSAVDGIQLPEAREDATGYQLLLLANGRPLGLIDFTDD